MTAAQVVVDSTVADTVARMIANHPSLAHDVRAIDLFMITAAALEARDQLGAS